MFDDEFELVFEELFELELDELLELEFEDELDEVFDDEFELVLDELFDVAITIAARPSATAAAGVSMPAPASGAACAAAAPIAVIARPASVEIVMVDFDMCGLRFFGAEARPIGERRGGSRFPSGASASPWRTLRADGSLPARSSGSLASAWIADVLAEVWSPGRTGDLARFVPGPSALRVQPHHNSGAIACGMKAGERGADTGMGVLHFTAHEGALGALKKRNGTKHTA